MGRATQCIADFEREQGFQSTPSVRRATVAYILCRRFGIISTHAFHGEGDIIGVDRHTISA